MSRAARKPVRGSDLGRPCAACLRPRCLWRRPWGRERSCGCGGALADGAMFCACCAHLRGMASARIRIARLVNWCVTCQQLRDRHGDRGLQRLLLEHGFDAGAAIARLAGMDGMRSLRVQLWRCVLNYPLFDPERDEWDGSPRRLGPDAYEASLLPCPKCGQRVVLPSGGVECHICGDPRALREFFAALDRGERPAGVPGVIALVDPGDDASTWVIAKISKESGS